jgi:glycosyltransferase involved in cell wall biosynthesis
MNTDNKKCKIVMIAMFKNEASVLKRMLDSTLGFCDYYVMQNNGSTDGSDEIAKQFLIDNELAGEVYVCEEGWQGFGWNRDHLIRYCQEKVNHGCDWILKMDCDEVLEVDDNFDWSLLENYDVPGFHIAAVSGTTTYHRCWMWNARMPWAFNHDPCHETIYHQDPAIGEGFLRVDLPRSIRQIGFNEGQSWSNPTKFVSDSLVLENKMISEGNMLESSKLYHFWYIGKSYFDAHTCPTFPLEKVHQREYARRAIWYFSEWIKHVYKGKPLGFNEMAYTALTFSADARIFLGEWEEALTTYKQAEVFAPVRNDHIIGQVNCYRHLKLYDKMLVAANRLLEPDRTNPFPHSASFMNVNDEHYYDTGTLPLRLHSEAMRLVSIEMNKPKLPFIINNKPQRTPRMFIVDNYYANPDEVRDYALTQVEYEQDLRWYKGFRSKTTYRPEGMKESFERIMGERIIDFESCYNGVFQIMVSSDPQVYHYDSQRWAAMIYLSPNAPIESGTRLHKSRRNATRHRDEPMADDAFRGDFYDSTIFDVADSAANIYNRLVIMDAGCFHSAGPYFGNTLETGRLTHLFFFD